ncbi:uncharacterized protein AMSG_01702 [Thecamonas trahens ATCC 50062]|uniref:Uncharacterized protein n=1 Tax=Thecamonas trahens ATCC 50062 TaxID=461836 RepID=A0A0L0DTP4_THETB|nr:hypothetical protein AMSG_01702 [Thecamonas trahens ATCC 50062]KNC54848.1 hypothetical protein AMSG_01702 [Thecamonas trahens ATCC 50062]|eukprot:XP_013761745.1 hypothetical protein AMSG_01702 [Thecamonas trahens ATCC 50062]
MAVMLAAFAHVRPDDDDARGWSTIADILNACLSGSARVEPDEVQVKFLHMRKSYLFEKARLAGTAKEVQPALPYFRHMHMVLSGGEVEIETLLSHHASVATFDAACRAADAAAAAAVADDAAAAREAPSTPPPRSKPSSPAPINTQSTQSPQLLAPLPPPALVPDTPPRAAASSAAPSPLLHSQSGDEDWSIARSMDSREPGRSPAHNHLELLREIQASHERVVERILGTQDSVNRMIAEEAAQRKQFMELMTAFITATQASMTKRSRRTRRKLKKTVTTALASAAAAATTTASPAADTSAAAPEPATPGNDRARKRKRGRSAESNDTRGLTPSPKRAKPLASHLESDVLASIQNAMASSSSSSSSSSSADSDSGSDSGSGSGSGSGSSSSDSSSSDTSSSDTSTASSSSSSSSSSSDSSSSSSPSSSPSSPLSANNETAACAASDNA